MQLFFVIIFFTHSVTTSNNDEVAVLLIDSFHFWSFFQLIFPLEAYAAGISSPCAFFSFKSIFLLLTELLHWFPAPHSLQSFLYAKKESYNFFSFINFCSYSNIFKSVYCFYSHGDCCLNLFWTIYQFFLQNLHLLPVHLQTSPFLTASSHLLLDISSALPTNLMLLSSRRNVLFLFYIIFYNSLFYDMFNLYDI